MQGECNDQLQRQLQTNADLSVQVQEGRRELEAMRQKTVDTILGMKEMLRQGATANAMRVCKCEHVLADALMCLQEYSEEQGSLAEQVATLRLSARKLVSSSQSRLAQAALNDQDDFGVHVTGGGGSWQM